MSEFELLERESAKLTATVEEFLRQCKAVNLKANNYLSRLPGPEWLPEVE